MSTKPKPPKEVEEYKERLSALFHRTFDKAVQEEGRMLEGQVLTLIDASISDPEQRKAFKDVMRGILTNCYYSRFYKLNTTITRQIARVVGDVENYEVNDECCTPDMPSFYLDSSKLDYEYFRKEK